MMALLNVVVDLSHHNTLTDNGFHQMTDAGIKAVIHKATQGRNSRDPEYSDRRGRANSIGMMWGAYHFAAAGKPIDQADHFLDVIGESEPVPTCLVLDFEPNSTEGTMGLQDAEKFVTRIHEVTGRFPVLYSGQSFIRQKLGNRSAAQTVLSQCPLWIARFSPHGELPQPPVAFTTFTLWQYTDGANGVQPHSVDGVVGRVDRDKFNGTLDELTQLFR